MENEKQQNSLHLRKDLVKIFIFFGTTVVAMVGLYFLNEQTGFITNLANIFTKSLIQQ